MNWIYKSFEDLTAQELYDVLKLRQDVFIIEQDCIYEDMDGFDDISNHLLAYNSDQKLIAYLRLFEAGSKYRESSIGRIIVQNDFRNTGIGKELVRKGIQHCKVLSPNSDIKIEAQAHLLKFYSDLGFIQTSDIYPVDGIDHIEMILKST